MSTEETNQVKEQQAPTKEQVLAHLNEQIEMMELRVKLQELHAAYAMAKAEEIKAIAFFTQMTQAPQQDTTLTEEEGEDVPQEKKLKKA